MSGVHTESMSQHRFTLSGLERQYAGLESSMISTHWFQPCLHLCSHHLHTANFVQWSTEMCSFNPHKARDCHPSHLCSGQILFQSLEEATSNNSSISWIDQRNVKGQNMWFWNHQQPSRKANVHCVVQNTAWLFSLMKPTSGQERTHSNQTSTSQWQNPTTPFILHFRIFSIHFLLQETNMHCSKKYLFWLKSFVSCPFPTNCTLAQKSVHLKNITQCWGQSWYVYACDTLWAIFILSNPEHKNFKIHQKHEDRTRWGSVEPVVQNKGHTFISP